MHKTEAEVWDLLRRVRSKEYNLLLNTGPLPDGELDLEDTEAIRAVGERIEREGLPGSDWPIDRPSK